MSPDLFSVLSVVLWVAAAPRLRDLGPGVSASRRSVAVAITALAVVTTAFAEVPGRIIDEVSGITYLRDLIGRGALMVAAVAAQCIFLTLAPTTSSDVRSVSAVAPAVPQTRSWPFARARTVVGRRMIVLFLALALLIAAFVVAVRTIPMGSGQEGLVDQSKQAPLAVYVITFTALLGWCFLDLIWAWLRLRHQVTGPLRTGLTFLAAGAVAGLGYVVLRLLGMVAEQAAWSFLTTATLRGCRATGTAAALLVTTGISWHTVHAWRVRAQQWWLARHRLLTLGPLWRDLVAAVPGIALQPPTRWGALTDHFKITGLPWRVYRRVIEIHDASLALHRRAQARRRGQSAPASVITDEADLARTVARVRDEFDAAQPTSATATVAAHQAFDQEAQVDRVVDIAEAHAQKHTTSTRLLTHRDHEDDR